MINKREFIQYKQITAKDLAAKNPSPEVQAIYDRALKAVYRDQQKILKAAAKLQKSDFR